MRGLRILLLSITLHQLTTSHYVDEELVPPTSILFYIYALISFLLSCFAGICSGLTVGYMSISKTEMQIWVHSEDENQRKVAKPILDILNEHHLLLSTLLLSNALSLEALPIFLDKIVPSYLAIIISTCAVVVFGEVLPQAYCTGAHKISIGYYFAPFIRLLQFVLFPFVRPISYVLDNWLGHHEDKIILTPENLKSILMLHNKKDLGYRRQEIEILQNTMDLRLKKIKDFMIPLGQVFMINENSKMNEQLLNQLQKYNFSKVPVFSDDRSHIIGFVKVKNLLIFKLNAYKNLKESGIVSAALKLNENLTLLDAIEEMKKKSKNFGIVVDQKQGKATGMITLKKIFEKLVLQEFLDDDNQRQYHWGKEQDGIYEAKQAKEQY